MMGDMSGPHANGFRLVGPDGLIHHAVLHRRLTF